VILRVFQDFQVKVPELLNTVLCSKLFGPAWVPQFSYNGVRQGAGVAIWCQTANAADQSENFIEAYSSSK
jgi:hypothetical protein